MIWRWVLVIAGVGLVSWAFLTANLTRTVRAVASVVGGSVIVVGLAPARARRSYPAQTN